MLKCSSRYGAQLKVILRRYMEGSYVKFLDKYIDDQGDALCYNSLSMDNTVQNRKVIIAKISLPLPW